MDHLLGGERPDGRMNTRLQGLVVWRLWLVPMLVEWSVDSGQEPRWQSLPGVVQCEEPEE